MDEALGQFDPTPQTARERFGAFMGPIGQRERVEHGPHAGVEPGAREAVEAALQADVFDDG